MKLGIHLPQYGRAASPEAITLVAKRAEQLGFSDVWVSDHVAQPADQGYPSPYLFEPLLALAWAAAATERIGLGTSVLVVPQYHPLQLANSLASLDQLSGGRLTIAAGVGWSKAEYEALDQDFSTRGARFDEALEIFRQTWTHDPASFDGNHYQFTNMRVLPQPATPIRIWIGGGSEAAYRRAIEHGDGFHAIATKPEDLAPVVAKIRAERPEDTFTVSYRTGWDPQGMDPGLIVDEAAAYAEAGVTHVVSAPWRTDAEAWIRSMEMLVELVPPDQLVSSDQEETP